MNAAKTIRPNTYAGTCTGCGGHVAASAGKLGGKVDGRWTVEHITCPAEPAAAPATSRRKPRSGNGKTEQVFGRRGMYTRRHVCPAGFCGHCHDEMS